MTPLRFVSTDSCERSNSFCFANIPSEIWRILEVFHCIGCEDRDVVSCILCSRILTVFINGFFLPISFFRTVESVTQIHRFDSFLHTGDESSIVDFMHVCIRWSWLGSVRPSVVSCRHHRCLPVSGRGFPVVAEVLLVCSWATRLENSDTRRRWCRTMSHIDYFLDYVTLVYDLRGHWRPDTGIDEEMGDRGVATIMCQRSPRCLESIVFDRMCVCRHDSCIEYLQGHFGFFVVWSEQSGDVRQ